MSMRMFLQKEDTLGVCRSTTVEWDGPGLEGGEGCEGELSASLSFPLPDSECSVAIAICSVATARATRDNVPLSPFTMDFISPQTGK